MIKSLFTGIARATRSWRLILLLLAANIALTMPVVLPIFLLIQQTTSGTLMARKMLADKLDIIWLADVFNQRIAGASLTETGLQVIVLLAVMGLIYLIVNTLLAGGIISLMVSGDERFSMKRFWAGCGAYFVRFLKLMLISILFYGAAVLVYQILKRAIDAGGEKASVYASLAYEHWVALALLLLMLALVNLVFDYAKIAVALNDSRRMFSAAISASRFVLKNFAATFGLYLVIAIIGLAMFALLAWLRDSIVQWSLIKVVIAFLIGQVAIAARMWTRLSFYAAELDLYRRRPPVGISETEPPKSNFEFSSATYPITDEPVTGEPAFTEPAADIPPNETEFDDFQTGQEKQ